MSRSESVFPVTDPIRDEEKPAIIDRFRDVLPSADTIVAFETDTSRIETRLAERWPRPDGSKYYRPFSPAFVIGSRLDKEFAESIGALHLSVSYPISNRVVLSRGYAGYRGGLLLIEDIMTVVLGNR